MKKLKKDQEKTRAEFVEMLRAKSVAIEEAVAEVNAVIDTKLNPAIEDYNGALTDIESFRDEIIGAIDEYIGERSEKWQESDAASNYESWKSDWENMNVEPIENADNFDVPDMDTADELENVAGEVES